MAGELELPFGPWSLLVSGTWGNYPFTIHANSDKALLLVVYDRTGETVSGLLVSMRQPLAVEGDLSKFILAQKREMVYQEKFAGGARYSYLFVGSSPAYIPYSTDDLMGEVKKQYSELSSLVKVARELVDGYGAKARAMGEGGEEWVQALLGDPFTVFALSKPLGQLKEEAFARSSIGLGPEGAQVTVRRESLERALVVGGSKGERLHALHVLTEAAVLANAPVVVFDDIGAFQGLALTSDKTGQFKEFGMTPMPVSFQFKSFELGRNLFVDLSLLTVEQFLASFGIAEADVAPLFRKVYEARKAGFTSLDDLAAEISKLPESKETPQYLIFKAVRLTKLVQRSSAGVFGKMITPELLRPWQEGMGRVYYVSLRDLRPQVANLVMASILQNLVPAPTKRASALVVLCRDAKEMLPFSESLRRFEGTGIGLALQADHEMDASFLQPPSLKVELIGMGQAALTEEGERKARFRLRPAFSKCTEENALLGSQPEQPQPQQRSR